MNLFCINSLSLSQSVPCHITWDWWETHAHVTPLRRSQQTLSPSCFLRMPRSLLESILDRCPTSRLLRSESCVIAWKRAFKVSLLVPAFIDVSVLCAQGQTSEYYTSHSHPVLFHPRSCSIHSALSTVAIYLRVAVSDFHLSFENLDENTFGPCKLPALSSLTSVEQKFIYGLEELNRPSSRWGSPPRLKRQIRGWGFPISSHRVACFITNHSKAVQNIL